MQSILKIKLTSKEISLMTFSVIDSFSDKIFSSSFNLKQHIDSLNIEKYIFFLNGKYREIY